MPPSVMNWLLFKVLLLALDRVGHYNHRWRSECALQKAKARATLARPPGILQIKESGHHDAKNKMLAVGGWHWAVVLALALSAVRSILILGSWAAWRWLLSTGQNAGAVAGHDTRGDGEEEVEHAVRDGRFGLRG